MPPEHKSGGERRKHKSYVVGKTKSIPKVGYCNLKPHGCPGCCGTLRDMVFQLLLSTIVAFAFIVSMRCALAKRAAVSVISTTVAQNTPCEKGTGEA